MGNTPNNPKQRLWPYLLALAVFAVVVLFLHFNPTFHCGGDNCRYLNVAKALRDGRGFRAIWLPALGLTIFMCLNITLNNYANHILTEAPFLFLMASTLISLFEFKRAGGRLRLCCLSCGGRS